MEKEELSTRARRASKEGLISTIKFIFGMTPFVGTALNEIIFEYGSRIKAARLERFVEHIAAQIQTLDEAKVDQEYLKSEDFYDIRL